MSYHFTGGYVVRRIEHAGATLHCMRIKNPRPLLVQGRIDIIRDYMDDMPPAVPAVRLPTPSARDITLMDEALEWIRLVPNSTSRRLISMRSQFHPITERVRHSWRACGNAMGVDHKTAASWHRKAICLLTAALNQTEVRSPVGCNVVAAHIGLCWLRGDADLRHQARPRQEI